MGFEEAGAEGRGRDLRESHFSILLCGFSGLVLVTVLPPGQREQSSHECTVRALLRKLQEGERRH